MPLLALPGQLDLFLAFPKPLLLLFGVLIVAVGATDALFVVLRCLILRAQRQSASPDRKSTRELQSLMRISYAVFCLKKKKTKMTYILTSHMTDYIEQ